MEQRFAAKSSDGDDVVIGKWVKDTIRCKWSIHDAPYTGGNVGFDDGGVGRIAEQDDHLDSVERRFVNVVDVAED